MDASNLIKEFVEGRQSLETLLAEISQNEVLQDYLSQDISIPPYTKRGNLLIYIMGLDDRSAAAEVNARDALRKFLDVQGVRFEVNTSTLAEYDLILKASPKWLSLPESYISAIKRSIPEGLDRKEKTNFIKASISKDFQYIASPPKWLQNPNWQFRDGRPLTFVGQLDIGTLLHDTSQVYVFIDPEDASISAVVQST
jgi:hypothetical protein